MKSKATLKIVIDLAMTAALLFLMGYQFWSDTAHEWAGAGMFVLFIAHHILNRGWYKALFKGKYTPARCFQLAVSLLLLLAMLGLMVSGILLSRHVFDFLNISGGTAFGRLLHIVCVHWGFVLMAMHLGLHWNMVMGRIRKAAHVKEIGKNSALDRLHNNHRFSVSFCGFIAFTGSDRIVFPVKIIQLYLDKINFGVFGQNPVQHVGGIME